MRAAREAAYADLLSDTAGAGVFPGPLRADLVPSAISNERWLMTRRGFVDAGPAYSLHLERFAGLFDETGDGRAPAAIPDELFAAFNDEVRRNYVATGDLKAARETALVHVQKRWAVTRVDGSRRLMALAPELVYGRPGADNTARLREQLLADLRGAGFDIAGAEDLGARFRLEAELAPDAVLPVYRVMRVNAEGVLAPAIDDDGNPLMWLSLTQAVEDAADLGQTDGGQASGLFAGFGSSNRPGQFGPLDPTR